MKPPFAPAADVLTVDATDLVMDTVGAGWIVTMSGVEISQYPQKER